MAKILLVEDDNNLREIYGARLTAEGYDIVSANDGEEALAIAVKEKPDLVITDVMMPRISGFDMLDILRNAPETKDTKVIMMTALSQAEDKARADSLGADMYLVKSQVTLEDVAKAVRDILNPDASDAEGEDASSQSGSTNPQANSSDSPPDDNTSSSDDSSSNEDSSAPASQSSQQVSSNGPAPGTPPLDPPQPTPPPEQPQPTPPPPEPEPENPPPPEEPVSTNPNNSSFVVPTPLTSRAPSQSQPAKEEPASDQAVGQTPAAADYSNNPSPPKTEGNSPTPGTKSSPTPIQVVLPDDSDEDNTSNGAINSQAAPAAQADAPPKPSIGPNLAEALADEEKSVNEHIQEFEKKSTPPPPPAPALSYDSSVPAEPSGPDQAPPSTPDNTPTLEVKKPEPQLSAPVLNREQASHDPLQLDDGDPAVKAADGQDLPGQSEVSEAKVIKVEDNSDTPKKKVIQPSEDFLKGGPNIDELLNKEVANEAVKRPDPSTIVRDPQSRGLKDPDQVIDEIEKTNQEINKIAL
ncbi:response regulator [Candidatus Parcubacteria bacterium]|nr:response regulator [Candidatus Parcubacteria bacterium]